jgi:hypothetical protein
MAAPQAPYDGSVGHSIGVPRLAATLSVGAALIFGLCWLGAFIPVSSPTHAYIGLFTSAQPNSGAALLEGTFWSFLFGALTGTLLAMLYNRFAPLDRR